MGGKPGDYKGVTAIQNAARRSSPAADSRASDRP
jgi:hypothetical protein